MYYLPFTCFLSLTISMFFLFMFSVRRNTEIYSKSDMLREQSSASYEVMVDGSVEDNIIFLVGTNAPESISVSVSSPNGQTLIAANTGSEVENFRLFTIKASNPTVSFDKYLGKILW